MYSQNQEENHIINYFGSFKGKLLDIGANDGKTYSNSLKLIEMGWAAVLVEPAPPCIAKLKQLHFSNFHVTVAEMAIGEATGEMVFHQSGTLNVPELQTENVSLVSTLVESEKERWKTLPMDWNSYPVKVVSWADFIKLYGSHYDFISIDAEGVDMLILKQINLSHVKLICVEWNLVSAVKAEILEYAKQFGMDKLIYETGENLIIGR